MSRIAPDEMDNPPVTLLERYARAGNSANLSSTHTDLDLRDDTDLMIAAGTVARARPSLVAALRVQRMVTERDPRDARLLIEFYDKELAHYLSKPSRRQLPKPARHILILETFRWLLDPDCPYCIGTGKFAHEGTAGRLSDDCNGCHGSGKKPLARAIAPAYARAAEWLVDEIKQNSAEAVKQMRVLLSRK